MSNYFCLWLISMAEKFQFAFICAQLVLLKIFLKYDWFFIDQNNEKEWKIGTSIIKENQVLVKPDLFRTQRTSSASRIFRCSDYLKILLGVGNHIISPLNQSIDKEDKRRLGQPDGSLSETETLLSSLLKALFQLFGLLWLCFKGFQSEVLLILNSSLRALWLLPFFWWIE